jgi:hypothetical protein
MIDVKVRYALAKIQTYLTRLVRALKYFMKFMKFTRDFISFYINS